MNKELEMSINRHNVLNNATNMLSEANNAMIDAITETFNTIVEMDKEKRSQIIFEGSIDVASSEPLLGLMIDETNTIVATTAFTDYCLDDLTANELFEICYRLNDGQYSFVTNHL